MPVCPRLPGGHQAITDDLGIVAFLGALFRPEVGDPVDVSDDLGRHDFVLQRGRGQLETDDIAHSFPVWIFVVTRPFPKSPVVEAGL